MSADLSSFVPRLVVDWVREEPEAHHRSVTGTMVFTDLSGFTAMSEQLAAQGKRGAEELTDHLHAIFSELLTVAGHLGGSLLKFGGDALLVFFWGDQHEARATRACWEMQRALHEVGLIRSMTGEVQAEIRIRMSVGAHCGDFDFFLVGGSHRELFVCGPDASTTVAMEGAAGPGEILMSPELAGRIGAELRGEGRAGGVLLVGAPLAESELVPVADWPHGSAAADFVPAMVRNELSAGVEITEHRQMAVGFVHLANVDHLLATNGPEATAQHLENLTCHVQEVFAHHGVAFVSTDVYADGPKLICAAGALRSFENDDERLLRALREVVDHPTPITLRAGVHRGHGFCGYVGPEFRRTFVTIGDVVNTAARVMANAKGGELLSTQGALDRSDTIFEQTELAAFRAKGKSLPLVAFRVGRVTGTRERRHSRQLPLIGRDHELEVLLSALSDVRAGQGGVVELVGAAGMGKSRLVEELRERAEAVPMFRGQCGRYATSTPYFPFRGLIGDVLGGRTIERLEEVVRERAPQLRRWLPLLADALDLRVASTPEVDALSPGDRRTRLNLAVEELLLAVLDDLAIVLVEDVHWIDEASSDLLAHLSHSAERLPIVLCVTARPEEGTTRYAPPDRVLELAPLAEDAAIELLQESASTHLMPQQLGRLAGRANGNPLFLAELAATMATGGGLDDLPDSLETLLAARVDALPPRERRAVRHLAVLGNEFRAWLASDVVDDLPEPHDRDRWACLSDFISTGGGLWRFQHALLRDAAYEGLSFRERAAVHRRAGEAIESRLADPDPYVELLSTHFHHAGVGDKALQYSRRAAAKAERRFAFHDAATFHDRCVAAARSLDDREGLVGALVGLGDALRGQGEFRPAHSRLEEALAEARQLDDERWVAEVQSRVGAVLRSLGEYSTARSLFEESLERFRRLGDAEREASQLHQLGTLAFSEGRLDEASSLFEESLVLLDALDEARDTVSDCLEALGAVSRVRGELEAARAWHQRSLEARLELGARPRVASSLQNLGTVAHQLGEYDEARRRYEEALEILREIGNKSGVSNLILALGTLAHQLGEYDQARRRYEEALAIKREIGDANVEAYCLHNLGDLAVDEGRHHDGVELCGASLELRRRLGDRHGEAASLTTIGRAQCALGELPEARHHLVDALTIMVELGDPSGVAECVECLAPVVAGLGEPAVAARLLGAAETMRQSNGSAMTPAGRLACERIADRLRTDLGDGPFDAHRAEGRQLSTAQAVAVACGEVAARTA